jgi:hypothetical protein
MSAQRRAEVRKQLIAIALRRVRPGSGSSRAFLLTRTARNPVVNIDEILKHYTFVVVGGIATRLYMPERKTDDFDILISATDRAAVHEELRRAGATYSEELDLRSSTLRLEGSSWTFTDGMSLDVIEGRGRWAEEALGQPIIERATALPFVSLPYLVLMKFDASRPQDIADLSRMLGGAAEPALSEVHRVVAQYMPDAVEDIESLTALGRLEYENSERMALGKEVATHIDQRSKHAAPIVKQKAALLLEAFEKWLEIAPHEVVRTHLRAVEAAQSPSDRKLAMKELLKEASSDPAVKIAYTAFLDAGRTT